MKILFNSEDRMDYEQTQASNCSIQIHKPVSAKKVSLISCQIPNTFYNITQSNNKFVIAEVDYEIPVGNYDLNQLLNTITTISGFTFTYSDISNRITISSGGIFDIYFDTENSIGHVLGFNNQPYLGSSSYVGPRPPKIYDNYLSINITSIPHNIISSYRGNQEFNFIVPIGNKSSIEGFHVNNNYQMIENINIHLFRFDIQIRNQRHEIVQGLSDFSFLLDFE